MHTSFAAEPEDLKQEPAVEISTRERQNSSAGKDIDEVALSPSFKQDNRDESSKIRQAKLKIKSKISSDDRDNEESGDENTASPRSFRHRKDRKKRHRDTENTQKSPGIKLVDSTAKNDSGRGDLTQRIELSQLNTGN